MLSSLRARIGRGVAVLQGTSAAVAAASLLIVASPTDARAAADPTIPLLTGGTITYSGTADRLDTHVWKSKPYNPPKIAGDYTRTRRGHVDFETSWLIEGRYDGVPVAKPVFLELNPAFDWKRDLGNGSHTRTQKVISDGQSNDFTAGCKWNIVLDQASYSYPLDETGRAWQLDPMLERAEVETSCDRNQSADDMFVGYDDPIEQLYRLPDEPAKERKVESTVELNRDDRDCHVRQDVTVVSCTDDIKGQGKLTLECAVCVEDVKYEHPDLPGGSWTAIPDDGTFDGNRVKVTAKLHNPTKKTVESPVVIRDLTHKRNLPTKELPEKVSLAAGQTVEISGIVDTTGLAWEDGPGKATYEHDVAFLSAYGGGQKVLRVRPKPAVLVHGWNSSAAGWTGFPEHMKAHSERWLVHVVSSMDTNPKGTRSIFENAGALRQEVKDLREKYDADHVDLVAHSMGGLISRAYIDREVGNATDDKPWVSHLVQLGTPNLGSPCAYLVYPATRGRPTWELTPSYLEDFNATVRNRKGIPFSVLIGWALPQTCTEYAFGDSVVTVNSARWEIADAAGMAILHTSMTEKGSVFTDFVAPRLEVGPGGAAGKAAATSGAAGAAKRLGGKVSVQDFHFGLAPPPTTDPQSKPKSSELPQIVATWSGELKAGATTTLAVAGERGTIGATVLAPAGATTELLDPKGKVAASVAPEQLGELLRSVSAKSTGKGTWKVRVKTASAGGFVAISGTVGGSKAKLTATTSADKKGRLTVSAKVKGLPGAKVTAELRTTGAKGKPVSQRLTLKRKGASYRATTKKPVSLDGAGVVVTAKAGGLTRVATATASRR